MLGLSGAIWGLVVLVPLVAWCARRGAIKFETAGAACAGAAWAVVVSAVWVLLFGGLR